MRAPNSAAVFLVYFRLGVSISTARRDCTTRWSAAACAGLMSLDTWLCAVLIAASADSTSGIDSGDQAA